MAEEFLEKIYKKANAYTYVNNLIGKYRNGNSDSNFLSEINYYIQEFVGISKELMDVNDTRGQRLWDGLIELSKISDLTMCLDMLEISILPEVLSYIKGLPRIDVDDEQGTILRSSELGFLYQINSNNMFRCDSAYNPMQEAYEIVKDYYNAKKYEYVILGGGLGYIPYQMYVQSEGEIHMMLFYHDQKSYNYARLYGVLDWIPKECLDVIISSDILDYLCAVRDKKCEFYVYKPEVLKYPAEDISALNDIIISQNTKFTTNKFIITNYYRNARRVDKFIDDYSRDKIHEKIIIVAGGPSVDENIVFLKRCQDLGYSIISVGTVFRKLLILGIRPDIVTACDPFITCSKQFENIDDNKDVPLFMGLETDYRVAKLYSGPKYFVPTGGICEEIYNYIKDTKHDIIPGSMTVTSFSFSIAKYLGAKEIYLVGADYGFPGGYSHAEGTNHREVVSSENHMKVLSNDGTMILTDPQMILYREEIESLIKNSKMLKVYNISQHGAVIKGATFVNSEEL